MKYTCKCCGFKTLDSEFNFDICDICDWEDDEVQNNNPLLEIWANKNNLYQSQINLISKIPLNIKDYNWYIRDEKWKPIKIDTLRNRKIIENWLDYFNEL